MKYLYLPLSLISITIASCNQENELKLQEGTVTNQSHNEGSNSNSLMQNLPSNTLPTQAVSNNLATASTSNSNVRLNPEHGQPGHQCEIAVGAPLNGQPIPTNNNTTTTAPKTPTTTPPVNISSSGNTGLNPEHGQPGHRCEIAVGAPLNSSPNNSIEKTIPAQQMNNSIQVQPSTPAQVTPVPKANTTPNPNAKLNPEHGQSGHLCEVAVGAPLPE